MTTIMALPVISIIWLAHALRMVSPYKMYYLLCWTQCIIQYYMVSVVQVAVCMYKNSVFSECVFDCQLDDCCHLFVSWVINSTTLNNLLLHKYEQYSISVPIESTLQSTANQDMPNQDYSCCSKYPLLDYQWYLFEKVCFFIAFLWFLPDLCYIALSSLVVLQQTSFFVHKCVICIRFIAVIAVNWEAQCNAWLSCTRDGENCNAIPGDRNIYQGIWM